MSVVVYGLIGGAIAYALQPLMKRYPRISWIAIATVALLIFAVFVVQFAGVRTT